VLERFSNAARQAVASAEQEARRLGHGHIGTEHLLLGILAGGEDSAARALVAAGATLDGSRDKVAEAVSAEGTGTVGDLQFTDRAKRTLERASRLSLRRHDEHVETEHVLLSLLDVEGTAGQVLRGLGVDLVRVRAALASPPDDGDTRAAHGASPQCAVCGSALDTALAHRVVTSHGESRHRQDFVVVYCSNCGSAIGATTA
jgi:ATP-dependent Clp protease ATP-binding subunit ClpA